MKGRLVRGLVLLVSALALGLAACGPKGAGVDDLRRRAEQGEASAQYELGELYYRGTGVGRDLVEAYVWFDLSADRLTGDAQEMARAARKEVGRRLSDAQLAEARRRVARWREEHQRGR